MHGGRSRPGPDPRVVRGGGLYRPQNGCTDQWVLWAPEILFYAYGRGKCFVLPDVSVLKMVRLLWRIRKRVKDTKKKHFDPDPTSGLDLG